MPEFSNLWAIIGWSAAALLTLGVGPLLFQAGCALADVNGPSYLRSLGMFALTLVLCVPLVGGLWWLAGGDPSNRATWWGPWCLLALFLGVVLACGLSALLYMGTLAAPYRKGLMIAGTEFVLAALLTALLSGIVLVILATVQVTRNPSGRAAVDVHAPRIVR